MMRVLLNGGRNEQGSSEQTGDMPTASYGVDRTRRGAAGSHTLVRMPSGTLDRTGTARWKIRRSGKTYSTRSEICDKGKQYGHPGKKIGTNSERGSNGGEAGSGDGRK